MYDSEQAKRNRQYYLSNGKCPRCGGKRPVEPGTKRCRECALKESEQNRLRKAKWIADGRCSRCGGERDDESMKTCSRCRAKTAGPKNARQKNAYERRKELGMCVRCGKRPAEIGLVYCRKCLDKHKKWQRNADVGWVRKYERRQKRIDAGLCIDCGRPTEDGKQRCKRCIAMRRESGRKYKISKRIKRENEALRLKLIAQNNGGTV